VGGKDPRGSRTRHDRCNLFTKFCPAPKSYFPQQIFNGLDLLGKSTCFSKCDYISLVQERSPFAPDAHLSFFIAAFFLSRSRSEKKLINSLNKIEFEMQ
jgi:hypothetical protein